MKQVFETKNKKEIKEIILSNIDNFLLIKGKKVNERSINTLLDLINNIKYINVSENENEKDFDLFIVVEKKQSYSENVSRDYRRQGYSEIKTKTTKKKYNFIIAEKIKNLLENCLDNYKDTGYTLPFKSNLFRVDFI